MFKKKNDKRVIISYYDLVDEAYSKRWIRSIDKQLLKTVENQKVFLEKNKFLTSNIPHGKGHIRVLLAPSRDYAMKKLIEFVQDDDDDDDTKKIDLRERERELRKLKRSLKREYGINTD